MKYLLSICIFTLSLNASIYYAKVEPYVAYSIKASVSGEVMSLFKEAEGKVSDGKVLIQIDDFLNKKELKSSKIKLLSLERTMKLISKNVKNSQEVERIREENYKKIKDLKTKSRTSKDLELINLINSSNQVLALKNSLENLKVSISDLSFKIDSLKDSISKKSVEVEKGFLIYKTYVDRGDFVNVGTPLVDVYDISKGKLTIYLSKEDVKKAKNSILYINDQKSDYKIDKIWSVVDTQNISSYKTEIIIPAPKRFSELLKIELK
ncbi:MAG: HlyD family secretion protein [Sulfurospirillum sp.]|nr:HlyD family secretion protein [Sulfurospirillum sp.]MBL0703710.1 HlyD family secretion protein [Sulfurospirillum sp.]